MWSRARQTATLGEKGGEKRREVLRPDDAVGRKRLRVLEEQLGFERLELVEIRALVADAVAALAVHRYGRLS